jgi:hypothetical protein
MTKAKLSEIAEAFDLQSDAFSAFLNRKTGAIEQTATDILSAIEDNDDDQELIDTYDVTEQEIALAREILDNNGPWLPLPSQSDIDEYRIMEQFCLNQNDPIMRYRLLAAINGKGAFKRFKDTAERTGVLEQWYEYREKEIKEIARQWCKENGVECE